MSEHHSKDRDGGLQNGRKTGRDVEFGPKEERIIHGKHQDASERENKEIGPTRRKKTHASDRYGEKHSDGDYESERDK